VPDALFYDNSLVSADGALSSAIKNSLYEICDARDCMFVCVRISSNSTEAAFLLFIALCKLRFPLDVSLLHYFTQRLRACSLFYWKTLLCMRRAKKMVTRCEKCALKAEKWLSHLLAIFCGTLAK
jgi:hypothetical protein